MACSCMGCDRSIGISAAHSCLFWRRTGFDGTMDKGDVAAVPLAKWRKWARLPPRLPSSTRCITPCLVAVRAGTKQLKGQRG